MIARRWRRDRGQSGLSLIEVLFVVGFSAALVTPIFALVFLTTNQFRPQELKNRSSSQLAIFRTHLINDWSRARVIRINATAPVAEGSALHEPTPTAALPLAKMDCRGGTYPYYASNTFPVIAIQTQESGNNTGRRIVYSIRTKANNKIDIIRRECAHLPVEGSAIGELDPWADSCPHTPPTHPVTGASCLMSSPLATERVIISDATAVKIPVGCNNGNQHPAYEACDLMVTLVAEDGQVTSPRLHQNVVSSGRMVGGIYPMQIGYDYSGRPS